MSLGMSDSLENARKFLESLQRMDLSKLISNSEIESGVSDDLWTEIVVRSPRPFAEAIAALPPHDRRRIADAVVSDEGGTSVPADIVNREIPGPAVEGLPALLPELIIHQEMMINVATGNSAIQDVNDYYIARQSRLISLCGVAGIPYENSHSDLWAWFHYYKEKFGSYAQRRKYIRDLFKAAVGVAAAKSLSSVSPREPTGWERVDRTLARRRGCSSTLHQGKKTTRPLGSFAVKS